MTALTLATALATVLSVGGGDLWIPEDCSGRAREIQEHYRLGDHTNPEAMREAFEDAVRGAEPGSTAYAPRPFPRTEEEILEDFRFAYFERLFGQAAKDKLPVEERPIYEAIQSGSIVVRIETVAGWGLQRCSPERPTPHFYLVRLFDPESGIELSRMALHYTGLWARYGHRDPIGDWRHQLPEFSRLPSILTERFNRSSTPTRAQYVETNGMPYCDLLTPCVAYEAEGHLYLLESGERLYAVERGNKSSLSPPEWRDSIAGRAPDLELGFVSLGFGFAPSRLVAGNPDRLE